MRLNLIEKIYRILKKVLHRPKKLVTFIEKLYDDVKKDSIDLKNSINLNRKGIQDIKKVSQVPKKIRKKDIYDHTGNLFGSMKKQLDLIKKDSYYIKKDIKSYRKEILVIKEKTYINKITFVKIEKHDILQDIKKQITIINNY